jgi:hypothetical protein
MRFVCASTTLIPKRSGYPPINFDDCSCLLRYCRWYQSHTPEVGQNFFLYFILETTLMSTIFDVRRAMKARFACRNKQSPEPWAGSDT